MKSLIREIEKIGNEQPGIQRFVSVFQLLMPVIQIHNAGYLLTAAAADEFASEATACANCFRQIQAAPLFHLSLSVLARVLVTNPRLEAAKIERGMKIARYLCGLGDKVENLRAEEAMLSFLLGATRIAVLSATHDAVERSQWLVSLLRNQAATMARLLARMIGIRLGGNVADRNTLLEHLSRADLMTYMLDSSLGGAEDSSFPGSQPGRKVEGYLSVDDMLAVFARCPPELQMPQAAAAPRQVTNDQYWEAVRAPLSLLRMYASQASVDAQSELLGIDYAEQRKLSRARISQIDYERPRGLLLRSFRSMRRLWVENAFRPGDPEIWPLTSEPTLMTLESALERALASNSFSQQWEAAMT
jgi:hypothetical protein